MSLKYFGGQQYIEVGFVNHTRRDGTETTLTRWRGECAECGAFFFFKVPSEASKFSPNRRCEKHRRPGIKVRKAS